jgi:hypothetical protein
VFPHVLADRQPDAGAAYVDYARATAGHEVALLVEYTVIRQRLLVVCRMDRAAAQQRSGVVQPAAMPVWMPDDEIDARDAAAQPGKRFRRGECEFVPYQRRARGSYYFPGTRAAWSDRRRADRIKQCGIAPG